MQGKAVLVRQAAMTEAAAASDRIVMGNSIVRQAVDYRPIWPFG
jgi:hypothetical protein